MVGGGIWHRISRFSIWNVPNYILESRGSFLGGSVDAIDRLAKIRSIAGTAIVIGAAVYYTGLSHLTSVATGNDGVKTVNLGGGSAGDWSVGVIASVVMAMFGLPLASLYLVWRANPGARKATLLQLRWPFLAIIGFWGILAAGVPFIAVATHATAATRHMNFGVRAAAYLFSFVVAITLLVWIVKSVYLAATGMFRAEDGHPLLPVITAPIVAASAAGMMLTNGYSSPPGIIGLTLTWGGTVTILLLSIVSRRILRGRFPPTTRSATAQSRTAQNPDAAGGFNEATVHRRGLAGFRLVDRQVPVRMGPVPVRTSGQYVRALSWPG